MNEKSRKVLQKYPNLMNYAGVDYFYPLQENEMQEIAVRSLQSSKTGQEQVKTI